MHIVRVLWLALFLRASVVDAWSEARNSLQWRKHAFPSTLSRPSAAVARPWQHPRMVHSLHALPSQQELQRALEQFEPVIGVEAHVQLSTQRKAFCRCSASYLHRAPNTAVCPVCIAEPGSLPVPNPKMIELGARLAMALQCETSSRVTFDRKHYFYPDTPKNYQITQHSNPIGRDGRVALQNGCVVGISRIQIEEDTAKVIYATKDMKEASRNMVDSDYALLDFNRAGIALLEVVSKPDIRDAAQAVEFAKELQAICRFLNVSSCNMEEGSLRLDVNLSLKPRTPQSRSSPPSSLTPSGGRVEVKNLNSFRAMQHAIEFEIVRQATLLDAGEGASATGAETRMWDEFSLETAPLRVKHGADGYRVSPEPNIPPIDISAHLPSWRSGLPELPHDKRERYRTALGLKDDHVRLLTEDPATSRYFEEAAAAAPSGITPAEIAEWVVGTMEAHLRANRMSISDVKLKPAGLAQLASLARDGAVTLRTAKQILPTLMASGEDVLEYVKAHDCFAISDRNVIQRVVQRTLQGEEEKAQQYRDGATRLWGYFVGKVMQQTEGRADPSAVRAELERALSC